MVRQHLVDWPFDNFGPHPMFLYSKLKWKPSDDIWFMTTSIGQN